MVQNGVWVAVCVAGVCLALSIASYIAGVLVLLILMLLFLGTLFNSGVVLVTSW
jgi:hypothetical protein